MNATQALINRLVTGSPSRSAMWIDLIKAKEARSVAEIGVWKGAFAAAMLDGCPALETYYMIDPWRHLEGWNKPLNTSDRRFEECLVEARAATDFAAEKRAVLVGTTIEVIDSIPDGSLDFAYVDGDHTLRGISTDLIRIYGKVRDGGWIGGDDFGPSIWQHGSGFEPTLVFPFAVYFAEAMDAPIYALPHAQFLLEKSKDSAFRFIDLAGDGGEYGDTGLKAQFSMGKALKMRVAEMLSLVRSVLRGK